MIVQVTDRRVSRLAPHLTHRKTACSDSSWLGFVRAGMPASGVCFIAGAFKLDADMSMWANGGEQACALVAGRTCSLRAVEFK